MNYRSLTADELERLAFVGDNEARLALADARHDMIPRREAETMAREAAYELLDRLAIDYRAAIAAAAKGAADDDDRALLAVLALEMGDDTREGAIH